LRQARDFLDRFRPAGAPGAASRAGIPADRAAERYAELEPVVALLADTHAECGRIVTAARQEAERIMDLARQQVATLAADTQRQAEAVREAAVQQSLTAARTEASTAVEAATARAGRRRTALASSRADQLAALAVELLRALPGADAPSRDAAGPVGPKPSRDGSP
jgi:vacuolar-type H+-ATPase subunit H